MYTVPWPGLQKPRSRLAELLTFWVRLLALSLCLNWHLLWHGLSVYNGHIRGPTTDIPIAELYALGCHYFLKRLRSVTAGIRTHNLPHVRRTFKPTAPSSLAYRMPRVLFTFKLVQYSVLKCAQSESCGCQIIVLHLKIKNWRKRNMCLRICFSVYVQIQ